MNNLVEYISEKLHISKGMKSSKDRKHLTDSYLVGDTCLVLTTSRDKIHIDVIKILDKSVGIFRFEYLTHLNSNINTHYIQISPQVNNLVDKYNYVCGNMGPVNKRMFITEEDALYVLDTIKKNNYKLDFNELLCNEKSTLSEVIAYKNPHSLDRAIINDDILDKIKSFFK